MTRQPVTYTEGPVGLTLYRMAWPMVWGLLATMSFNAIDTLFVAQLGANELAAMSFTFPVVMVISSMGIGLGAGVSSVLSRQLGKRDMAAARVLLTDALLLAGLISIALFLIGWLSLEPLFRLLGATDALLPLVKTYMQIWFLNTPLLVCGMVLQSGLRARGSSKVAGMMMLASAVLNGILDPLLIFGLLGLPRMEMAGAALATLLSRLALVVVGWWYVHHKYQMLGKVDYHWQRLKTSWAKLLHVGLPAMVANVIIPLSSGVVVALVAGYGPGAVAGLGVAMRIEPVMLIVFYSLSSVAGPFFGQNLGAGNRSRMRKGLRLIGIFCLGLGVILALLLGLLGEWLAGFFSQSPDVLPVAVAYLTIVPWSYGFYGVVMSANAAFNGVGKPLPSVALSSARVLFLYLPLAWLFQWLWGLQGLFVATALANASLGVWAFLWLRHTLRHIAVDN